MMDMLNNKISACEVLTKRLPNPPLETELLGKQLCYKYRMKLVSIMQLKCKTSGYNQLPCFRP